MVVSIMLVSPNLVYKPDSSHHKLVRLKDELDCLFTMKAVRKIRTDC